MNTMNTLDELINQKVIAYIGDEIEIEGIVTGVAINDFYFQEKNEPIYITVSLNPTSELPNMDDEELVDLISEIPLESIRKV